MRHTPDKSKRGRITKSPPCKQTAPESEDGPREFTRLTLLASIINHVLKNMLAEDECLRIGTTYFDSVHSIWAGDRK